VIRAIEHIAIAAADTAGLAKWYCDVLGFRVVVEGTPGGTWFVGPPEGAAVVEIVPATAAARAARERNDPGWSHLAFTVSDFDAVCAGLRARGVTFTGEPSGTPGGRRLAFFLDGEGNVLQLVQRPEPLVP
jgi:catechol 2,3-dioxygenase-like lactoylglutathione lyase family enzyme